MIDYHRLFLVPFGISLFAAVLLAALLPPDAGWGRRPGRPTGRRPRRGPGLGRGVDHVRDRPDRPPRRAAGPPSAGIFDEVAELVRLADRLGVRYAWFAEHHAHAHQGHLPTPLLLALHLAGQTRDIRLGTAIICLNLHHPLDVAEQVAVADVLTGGRMAVGFGSGSTPEEFGLFGLAVDGRPRARTTDSRRRCGSSARPGAGMVRNSTPSPSRPPDLAGTAAGSRSTAPARPRIAGASGFNMLFSHLRTPEQYRQYVAAYREAGGRGLVAANRPVFVGPDDRVRLRPRRAGAPDPLAAVPPRRARSPPIPPSPPTRPSSCAHPINFIVGGPEIGRPAAPRACTSRSPSTSPTSRSDGPGLSQELVLDSLRRLMEDAFPLIRRGRGRPEGQRIDAPVPQPRS